MELIAGARDREDRSQNITSDIDSLERTIEQVLDLLERVSTYVGNVIDEEAEPSSALGQYLMNTLSLAPKVEAEEIENSLYVVPSLHLIITCTTTGETQKMLCIR